MNNYLNASFQSTFTCVIQSQSHNFLCMNSFLKPFLSLYVSLGVESVKNSGSSSTKVPIIAKGKERISLLCDSLCMVLWY